MASGHPGHLGPTVTPTASDIAVACVTARRRRMTAATATAATSLLKIARSFSALV